MRADVGCSRINDDFDLRVLAMKFWLPLILFFTGAAPAFAQLQLPGAMTGPDSGAPAVTAAPKPKPKPKPAVKIATEESVVERELYLNGRYGRLEFGRAGKEINLRKLKLGGDLISKPGEKCEVDVVAGEPLTLKSEARLNGAPRYAVEAPACPFAFDVLDGAVLVARDAPVCEFKAADCRVTVGGLWGPSPNSFAPPRIKEFERGRTQAEQAMRDGFRSLLAAQKDKAEIRKVAGEQAGFSAEREMMCRDYAREDTHGFCGLRVTEARVASLRARLGKGADAAMAPKPKKKPKPKPKPVEGGAPMTLGPGMGGTF